MSMLPNGSDHPIPAPQHQPSTRGRDLVIVCDACPLEAEEIRRAFRHADALGDFYFYPGAESVDDLIAEQDFFGSLSPSAWRADPVEDLFYRAKRDYANVWLINPSTQLLENLQGCGYEVPKLITINGNSDAHPAAIIQVQSELGLFPDRRQQLVAYFAKHYISPPENIHSHLSVVSAFPETIPTRTELDWLLSRNYRLQGIGAEQEQFARETWATRSDPANWVCGGGFSANLITIETPYADCTPFYDLIYRDHCDRRFRAVRHGLPLALITTPKAHYLISKLSFDYLFDELHKDVEARGLTLPRVSSMRLSYGAVSVVGFTPPGGLRHHARVYRPLVYVTYSRDLDPTVITESSIFN